MSAFVSASAKYTMYAMVFVFLSGIGICAVLGYLYAIKKILHATSVSEAIDGLVNIMFISTGVFLLSAAIYIVANA